MTDNEKQTMQRAWNTPNVPARPPTTQSSWAGGSAPSPRSPMEPTGIMRYLNSLFNPQSGNPGIPDGSMQPYSKKRVLLTSTLTGATEYVLIHMPFSRLRKLVIVGKTVNHPAFGNKVIGVDLTKSLTLDEDLSKSYDKTRLVSGALEMAVTTIPAGNFVLDGRMTGTVFVQPIDPATLDPTSLTSYNTDDAVSNVSAQEGLLLLSLPAGTDIRFKSTEATGNGSLNSGTNSSKGFAVNFPTVQGSTKWSSTTSPLAANQVIFNTDGCPGADGPGLSPRPIIGDTKISIKVPISVTPSAAACAFTVYLQVFAYYIDETGTYKVLWVRDLCVAGGTGGNGSGGSQVYTATHEELVYFPTFVHQVSVQVFSIDFLGTAASTIRLGNYGVTGGVNGIVSLESVESAEDNNFWPATVIRVADMDASATVTLSGINNFEAIPNMSLSQQLEVGYHTKSHMHDMALARNYLQHGPLSRRIWRRGEYSKALDYLYSELHYDNLKRGYSFSFGDLWSGIKRGARFFQDNADTIGRLATSVGMPWVERGLKFAKPILGAVGNSASFGKKGQCAAYARVVFDSLPGSSPFRARSKIDGKHVLLTLAEARASGSESEIVFYTKDPPPSYFGAAQASAAADVKHDSKAAVLLETDGEDDAVVVSASASAAASPVRNNKPTKPAPKVMGHCASYKGAVYRPREVHQKGPGLIESTPKTVSSHPQLAVVAGGKLTSKVGMSSGRGAPATMAQRMLAARRAAADSKAPSNPNIDGKHSVPTRPSQSEINAENDRIEQQVLGARRSAAPTPVRRTAAQAVRPPEGDEDAAASVDDPTESAPPLRAARSTAVPLVDYRPPQYRSSGLSRAAESAAIEAAAREMKARPSGGAHRPYRPMTSITAKPVHALKISHVINLADQEHLKACQSFLQRGFTDRSVRLCFFPFVVEGDAGSYMGFSAFATLTKVPLVDEAGVPFKYRRIVDSDTGRPVINISTNTDERFESTVEVLAGVFKNKEDFQYLTVRAVHARDHPPGGYTGESSGLAIAALMLDIPCMAHLTGEVGVDETGALALAPVPLVAEKAGCLEDKDILLAVCLVGEVPAPSVGEIVATGAPFAQIMRVNSIMDIMAPSLIEGRVQADATIAIDSPEDFDKYIDMVAAVNKAEADDIRKHAAKKPDAAAERLKLRAQALMRAGDKSEGSSDPYRGVFEGGSTSAREFYDKFGALLFNDDPGYQEDEYGNHLTYKGFVKPDGTLTPAGEAARSGEEGKLSLFMPGGTTYELQKKYFTEEKKVPKDKLTDYIQVPIKMTNMATAMLARMNSEAKKKKGNVPKKPTRRFVRGDL